MTGQNPSMNTRHNNKTAGKHDIIDQNTSNKIQNMFGRSQASQSLNKQKDDNKTLEKILNRLDVLDKMNADIEGIKKELNGIRGTIKEVVKEELEVKEKVWKEEKEIILSRLDTLEKSDELSRKKEIEKNITIKGFEPLTNDLTKEVHKLLLDKLQLNIELVKVKKIQLNTGSFLIAELANMDDKFQVLKKKRDLVGSSLYISGELTKKERNLQNQLFKSASELRDIGHNVKIAT